MIWLILGILSLSALLYICTPLYSQARSQDKTSAELESYRNQIAEIDTNLERGIGNADELKAIKTGLQRQLLKSDASNAEHSQRTSRSVLIGLFLMFGLATIGIYSSIGRPELTRTGSLQKMKPAAGPSAEQMRAAESLTAEQRAEMIQGMVDGLSQKLEDNPDNPEGWIRLLTARKVLGQIEQANSEVERLKDYYAEKPEAIDAILQASGWVEAE